MGRDVGRDLARGDRDRVPLRAGLSEASTTGSTCAATVAPDARQHGRRWRARRPTFRSRRYHLALRLRIPEVRPSSRSGSSTGPRRHSALPRDLSDRELVFGAAFDGFVTDAWRLGHAAADRERVVSTAVPRAHADRLLAEITPSDGLIERVSAEIPSALREDRATAETTASRLGMTRRTLTRRLAQRGTSYSDLLQEARFRTAMHYLRNTGHSVEDIAFLLGFSECPPFVRAFKRWSGHAPLEYRRLHARSCAQHARAHDLRKIAITSDSTGPEVAEERVGERHR